mgnify:CR=1 FL=1|jgi:RNA polymerase subunit RPABC4/transcription elongation factor Spt4
MNCQHCKEPNPERFFNCPSCGLRAAQPKWNTNFVVRENNPYATAIRKDQMEIKTLSHEEGMKKLKEGADKTSAKGPATRIM